MSTTVNVVCYKSKVLSNNESPLMLRVTKDRKRKYVSLGISVNPEHWDFSKNQPKADCPNREFIELMIAEKLKAYNSTIIELKATNQEFTSTSLVDKVDGGNTLIRKTVNNIFTEHLQRLENEKRRGYMLSVRYVYNSLINFNKHLNITFSEIDVAWLKRYESWLRSRGVSQNTIGIHFRTLRVLFNVAIEQNAVKEEHYPFKSFKVSKLHEETAHRALSKEHIERILNFKATDAYMRFAIDIFAFTYYSGGINLTDIANLTADNIIADKLIYKRQKTGKLIKIPLQDKAKDLIDKYRCPDNRYLFPIFSDLHQTEAQKKFRIHKVMSKINKRLKIIGKELGIPITLTTYVARHSQATVMKRAGVSTAVIREIMGHSSERVTQIYLDSFDNEQVNNALKSL
ncbi:MAG: site-specific integrase [Muribaculaceae bacterium]|nr:site-specific integrase [Muribaculaceae bacterium]